MSFFCKFATENLQPLLTSEFGPARFGCPRPIEKFFNLPENYLKILAYSQVSDCCPLGYLLSKNAGLRKVVRK